MLSSNQRLAPPPATHMAVVLGCFVLFALCMNLLSWGTNTAPVHDHIVERGWLEDSSRSMSLADVKQRQTQPFTDTLSLGYGHSAIWVRLRIKPHAHRFPTREPERLLLRIRPVYLDDIQVFDPLAPGELAGVTGDRHPAGIAEFEGLDFLLPIARGDAVRDVWLRVTSTSTRQIDIQALNIDDIDRLERKQALTFAGYIGVILIFAIWGLAHALVTRDLLVGSFGLAQLTALGFALGSLGYMRVFWPSQWPAVFLDQTTSVFSVTAVSSAILFHVLFLREFDLPAQLRRLHSGMVLLLPLKLLLLLMGWTVECLTLNMLEVLLSPIIFLGSVLLSPAGSSNNKKKPILSRTVVIGFYITYVIMLALAAFPGLGLTPGGQVTLYLVQGHGIVTGFLILSLLQYRAHVLRQRQQETSLELERIQLQADQEHKIRQEQENLLSMLVHELKTPLATMQMRLDPNAAGSREVRQAIRDMNSVIERCVQSTLLNDKQFELRLTRVDMVMLLHDCVSACAQPFRIQLQTPASLLIDTDQQFVSIIISNLLENACKYSAPNTPIEVELKHEALSRTTLLSVSNLPGAAGWPDSKHVFDKYYRSPHARRQTGTGLGLFIVQNLVRALGGGVNYSPDDKAICFVLEFPDKR